ncbi:MAG: adenylate/guanylate cyclase domain-containing protein [Actinomycetota bacterium]
MRACPSCKTSNAASAKFCQECGARLAPGPAPGAPRRRLITAVFCDLVGSTELAEHIDPEPLRKLLDRYFESMRASIERHGGSVEKFIGDAVVGTFGAPLAHEDDTLRAVRAALEMRKAAADLDAELADPDVRVRVRIGISSGEALADEATASQGRISGDVFNTAARLQSVAEPGDVVVSVAAERMLQGRVDLAPLGPITLKGKAEPVGAYRVLGVRTQAVPETPLVGRERALSAMLQALEDAIDASACVLVTVLAPAGVGKSRLATAFAEAVRERATVLVGQTPSYGEGVTFAPLIELLAHASEEASGDAEKIATALRERLAGQPDGASVGDRIAQILGVGEAVGADASWAVRRLLEVVASERSLVVVLEDAHWAEPPMLDLLDSVVERIHGPTLVLCLARPELLEQRPTWAAGKPRTTTMTLPPLSAPDAHRLAELLLGADAPASVVQRVCETAEGNPLYLEQLTAMLIDQQLLVDGRWVGAGDAEVEIPVTLQALLASRLDRLDPSTRLVLETASVQGRRFRVAALLALAPEAEPVEVEAALVSLDRRGLVQPEDETGGRWRFAHALIAEAAYRGLPKELRADLHERLADWIVQVDAEQPDVDESVARHLERALHFREELGSRDAYSAGLAARAGELFANAGARAFAALDLITSRDLLGRAAALLPAGSPRRLDILPNLGVALTETGRPEESDALLAEAIEQARAVGSERDALRATIQLQANRVYRSPTDAEIASAVADSEAAAAAFEASSDEVGLAEAAIALEYLEFVRGRAAKSHEWTLLALRSGLGAGRPREAAQAAADVVGTALVGPLPFDRFAETAEASLFPLDGPIAASTGFALMALGALGVGDEGSFHEHERRWREVIDRNGLTWLGAAHGLVMGNAEIWAGNAEGAERRLREARDVLAALGDIWWIATLDSSLCSAVAAQDRPSEFLRMADALETTAPVPDRQILVRRNLVRARALQARGSAADAELAARRGLELVEATDLVLDHADALLTLADVLRARGLRAEAETARSEALGLLRAKDYGAAVTRLGG